MSRSASASARGAFAFDHDMESPVLIAQPIVHHAAASFFGFLLVAGIAFCVGPQFAQQETVRGEIVATTGFTIMGSDAAGTVTGIYKRVGDPVEVGELLARIMVSRQIAEGRDTAKESAHDIRMSLASVEEQMATTREKLTAVSEGRARLDAVTSRSSTALAQQSALSQTALDLIASRRRKIAPLQQRGFISQSTMDELEGAELRARQERRALDLQAAEMERSVAERNIAAAEETRSARLSLAELRQRWLELRAELQAARTSDVVEVRAQGRGVVSAIRARPGQRIRAGDEILAISQRSADVGIALQVPSIAVGRMRVGQTVNIKLDAFPFSTYGIQHGRIVAIDEASLQAGSRPEDASPAAARTFGVEVKPDRASILVNGTPVPLKIGMELTADVTIDRRNLFGWWLEPLQSMRGRSE